MSVECPHGNHDCDPNSQHPCFGCKMDYMRSNPSQLRRQLDGGKAFVAANEGNYTQREIWNDTVAQARADGTDLQKAR